MKPLFAMAGLLLATSACAQEQQVVVPTTRDPVDKSYRRIAEGMELFEKMHALAPKATLRFKLLPRKADTRMDGISVRIKGESFSLPVEVGPDKSFALPLDQKAYDEDASVMPNRRSHTLTWRTDIRTPGLPPNTRRLGDLRLECFVGIKAGLVSEGPPVIGQLASVVRAVAPSPCTLERSGYFFFADRPVFEVTLSDGERKEVLPVARMWADAVNRSDTRVMRRWYDIEALQDHSFWLPLGDKSWSDDTLVSFDYMEEAR